MELKKGRRGAGEMEESREEREIEGKRDAREGWVREAYTYV